MHSDAGRHVWRRAWLPVWEPICAEACERVVDRRVALHLCQPQMLKAHPPADEAASDLADEQGRAYAHELVRPAELRPLG